MLVKMLEHRGGFDQQLLKDDVWNDHEVEHGSAGILFIYVKMMELVLKNTNRD